MRDGWIRVMLGHQFVSEAVDMSTNKGKNLSSSVLVSLGELNQINLKKFFHSKSKVWRTDKGI